jgi:trans-aconitate 2-methyltransferase
MLAIMPPTRHGESPVVTWDAEDYSRSSSAQQVWARELIGKLRLQGNESVLDIGCGDGRVTAEIAALVPGGRVLGIDNSPEMIGFASRNRGGGPAGNLAFLLKDAGEMDFEEEFDVVFSNATLHWVIDHQPVLRCISRALRPAGRILLQMGGRGNAAEILALMDDLPADPKWQRHFPERVSAYGFHGPEEYAGWLIEAGLTPVRLELLPKDMAQRGKDGLASWLRTTWLPYTQRVPEDMRDEFVSEMAERYLHAHPPDGAGLVHVQMFRLEVEARKDSRLPA